MQLRTLLRSAPRWPLTFSLVLAPLAAPASSAAPAASRSGEPEPARVELKTEDAHALYATYYPPLDAKQKAAPVVLVHDTGASRAGLEPIALRLQKSGFAVLAVDLRGHGESANGENAWKSLDEPRRQEAWGAMTRDLKAAVDFLGTRDGVSCGRINLVGRGAGAALSARYAIRDERVRGLVMIDPRAETFGRPLSKELEQLDGLPTLLCVGKEGAGDGQKLIDTCARGKKSAPSIELRTAKVGADDLLADKLLQVEVSRWIIEKSAPKKVKG